MLVPDVALTPTQYSLLRELMLVPLSPPTPEAMAARGLSSGQVTEDASALIWMGLIEKTGETLAATALGAAFFHRAEHEEAMVLLADVAAFADALENEEKVLDQQRIAGSLRRLAQGACNLQEAISSTHTA
ncbi:hypothetical protein ABZ023_17120 [Streptomyces sp. NPDC006367]|uniref:hypothetical protein n=1 Tax=unclassified Streptomyces TaxID=2593676 RepID=UPI0033BB0266